MGVKFFMEKGKSVVQMPTKKAEYEQEIECFFLKRNVMVK